jgi:hypothetical protein
MSVSEAYIGRRALFVVISIIVAIQLMDTIVGNIADFQYDPQYSFLQFFLSTQNGVNFFTLISLIFIAFQSYFLYFSRKYLKHEIETFRILYNITLILHCIMVALLIIGICQIILEHEYAFALSKISVGIGSSTAAIIFLLLTKKLFSWYSAVKNKLILIFGTAFLLLATTKVIFELGIFFVLSEFNANVTSNTIVEFPDYRINALLSFFEDSYWIFAIASFFLLWLGTVLLIQNYKSVIGIRKYRLITVLSLLTFAPTPIGIYLDESDIGNLIDPVAFYTFTALNATVAAILFFITFSTLAKSIKTNERLKNYLLITGMGLLLYFVSDQATIEQHAYPPYGLITLILLGFSSYLIYVGLLSSAISVSRDSKLRHVIISKLKEQFLYDISIGELDLRKTNQMKKVLDLFPEIVNSTKDIIPLEQNEVRDLVEQTISDFQQIKVEENRKKGYFILQLECLKCQKYYRIQINLIEDVNIYPNCIQYPESKKFECTNCNNEIKLYQTLELIKKK